MEESDQDSSSDGKSSIRDWVKLHTDQLSKTLQTVLQERENRRHAFWEKQPVQQYQEKENSTETQEEGIIEAPNSVANIRTEPYRLPKYYEWCTCDVNSDETMSEVYNLLKHNYVEDDENMFRFNYSVDFLRWALRPPGYFPCWHVGVRVQTTKKLVAFITGIPARIRIREKTISMAAIDFLCIHKKLRSKRLAPLLIREITRRVHLENVWQAIYTAGIMLPTPFVTCQYWHRSLNPKKLIEIGFSTLGPRTTMNGTIKFFSLPEKTVTLGFRQMLKGDVSAVQKLLQHHLSQYIIAPEFSDDDVEHWLMPVENVIESFVVEDPESHEITDFCSFYMLPSTILDNPSHKALNAAYLYYHVNTKTPLSQLLNDTMVVAKQKNYDVFNALDIMQNESVFEELKFRPGDGLLRYYLYNYRLNGTILPHTLGLVLL